MNRFAAISIALLISNLLFAHTAPVAKNDTVSVPENRPISIAVTTNDSDPGGGQLTVSILSLPQHGAASVTNGNQFLYIPQPGYFGPDSFSYIVCDTFNLCDTAEVYINILGSSLAPIAIADSYTFPDTVGTLALNVLANDSDPHHDTIFVTAVQNIDSTIGNISIDSTTGAVVFTHTPSTCGTGSYQYTVCNYSLCDTATITIGVSCPDNIFLPQGFSPNGDGKNDQLVFTNLAYFSPASLKVFNRYGTMVYTTDNYLNDWNGTDMDSHNPLPDGTYFYILQLSNNHVYNNYIVINR